MKDFLTSKLPLFDILAMIIPGWLIYLLIPIKLLVTSHPLNDGKCQVGKIFLILIFSYIIGLIWNMIMEWIFEKIKWKNNILHITYRYYKSKKMVTCSLFKYMLFNCPRILSLFCKYRCRYNVCRNYQQLTSSSFQDKNDILKLYYHYYYFVLQNRYSDVIPILEGQVAFLRNIIGIIFILGLIAILKIVYNSCRMFFYPNLDIVTLLIIFGSSVFLFWGAIVTMISRQDKIYQRVWEDYEYLSSK